MATAATSLLGLALPVTGELSGTWGDTVNNSLTALLDTAVAGTTTLSSDADVTLSTTTLAANQARQAVILWTAGGTVTRNITAPAQSKPYTVINKTSNTQSIVLRGAGPTTGVTIVAGEKCVAAWDGADFVKVSNTLGAGAFTTLTTSSTVTHNGGTANGVAFLNGSKVLTTGSALTFDGSIFRNVQGLGTAALEFNTLSFSRNGANYITATLGTLNYGASQHIFGDNTLASEWMRLTNAGNLGIGNTSPGAKLEAAGNLRITNATITNSAIFQVTSDATGSNGVNLESTYYGSGGYGPIKFTTSGTERARIDSSGRLLVGSTTTIGDHKAFITQAAALPCLALQVTGSDFQNMVTFYNSSGTVKGSISSPSGSAVAYNTSSDYRLKENIAPMAGALAKVQQLKPCTYTWKDSGQAWEGFIAHEVAEVIPNAVTGEKDAVDAEGNPQYQGIDTSFLVATLTAAIQEQQALITSLTARITALESI
jgi:hypothetical protein